MYTCISDDEHFLEDQYKLYVLTGHGIAATSHNVMTLVSLATSSRTSIVLYA